MSRKKNPETQASAASAPDPELAEQQVKAVQLSPGERLYSLYVETVSDIAAGNLSRQLGEEHLKLAFQRVAEELEVPGDRAKTDAALDTVRRDFNVRRSHFRSLLETMQRTVAF